MQNTLEKQKLSFSCGAVFHLQTRVSLKYFLNVCFWKHIFGFNFFQNTARLTSHCTLGVFQKEKVNSSIKYVSLEQLELFINPERGNRNSADNHFHNIVKPFNVLPITNFTKSETMSDYYLQTWYIRLASQVAERPKTLVLRKLWNLRKVSKFLQIVA